MHEWTGFDIKMRKPKGIFRIALREFVYTNTVDYDTYLSLRTRGSLNAPEKQAGKFVKTSISQPCIA